MDCSDLKTQRPERGARHSPAKLARSACIFAICLASSIAVESVARAVGAQYKIERMPLSKLVHLRGTLWFEKHYGPPGYGEDKEHDQILTILAFRLDTPIDLIDPDDATRKSNYAPIGRVQIWGENAKFD